MPSAKKAPAKKRAPAKRKAKPRTPRLIGPAKIPSNAMLIVEGREFPTGPVDVVIDGRTVSAVADAQGSFVCRGVSGKPGVCTARAYISVKGELRGGGDGLAGRLV